MTLDTHNWSSSAHQEIHKILKEEIFPIINQVDSRLQNFEIQFLKEAAKFVRDFKSLAKEADESLAKHKTLELEIERLLRAVVSQDIMSIVQNPSVVDSSNLQTELDRTKERLENFLTKWTPPKSNTKNDRVPSASKSSCNKNKEVEVEEHHRNLLLSKNKKHMSSECKHVKLDTRNDQSEVICAMCKQCLITANHDVCMLNYVNDMNSRGKKQKANVSNTENQKKQKPKVKKPKKVGSNERLASPKPSKPRFCLRWSPTGRFFDIKGKIIASSESESQPDCSNGDNACTSNPSEPKIKRFPNSTFFLGSKEKAKGRLTHPNQFQILSRGYTQSYGWCGPMEIASINGKRYVLVDLVITVLLQSPVIIIRTDNGTEFKNQILKEYFDSVGISHQASSVRTPQQNGVVEQRNRTLVEAARTMLIFSRAPLSNSFWNRSANADCEITLNDREDIGKLGAKGDIGFFIGYSADSCAYRVYNQRTKKIMETMNVTFDELSAMAFEQS
ncbi:retrovirus-related pol polyprotein from transposon TNT 1-94 [Tanacetum coccineum]